MLAWLRNLGTKRRPTSLGARAVRFIRAKFDSAQTTPDNRRHWANADYLAADAAATPDVRRTLRSRARYEVANNSYARGIVLTLANDVIGTGPRLQMLLGNGADAGANQTIEREFAVWARAVDLAGKLRTMRMARAQDGEAFALLVSNDNLDSPVKLDLRLVEADQVTTPGLALPKAGAVDGIVFDEFGSPAEYHVLKAHPGGATGAVGQDYDKVPAASVIHWFRADRPGQSRGLPDILPALPLFAKLSLRCLEGVFRCHCIFALNKKRRTKYSLRNILVGHVPEARGIQTLPPHRTGAHPLRPRPHAHRLAARVAGRRSLTTHTAVFRPPGSASPPTPPGPFAPVANVTTSAPERSPAGLSAWSALWATSGR